MAEIYSDSIFIEGMSPEDGYTKGIAASVKTFPNFVFWKKNQFARLFAIREKNNQFSTINFFVVTKENGIEIEVRFNTKGLNLDQLKSMLQSFKDEMTKE